MRAIVAGRLGGPEVLELQEIPDPKPAPGQVLIKVFRAGVNFADLASTQGRYREAPPPPFVPGLELSGTEIATGRPVIAVVPSGAYAEMVAADNRMVFDAEGLDPGLAAGYPITGLTAYFALAELARIRKGETVLVTGAAGGVGTAIIQCARALGAGRVVGMASTPEKRNFAMNAGADLAIGYDDEVPFPLDIVVDTIGEGAFKALLPLVRPMGRVVLVGSTSGEVQKIPTVGELRIMAVGVFALSLGAFRSNDPDLFAMRAASALELVRRGKIQVSIGEVLPLSDAAEAHRMLAERRAMGKIVVDVSG